VVTQLLVELLGLAVYLLTFLEIVFRPENEP
jgi:hypothetical protein